jgi:serine/threonine protein kinase
MKDTELFQLLSDEHDPSKREELLTQLCESDEQRAQMVRLLAAESRSSQFFEDPVEAMRQRQQNTDTEPLSQSFSAGLQVGPYKLLQEIGEGGMGLVFMAEQQEPVQRRVALKVIKPGMDTRQVIARFEAERQALAMMDHPNIAKVLDAGTTEGGYPYFVMELVNGNPITEYCDQETLTTKQRLELFIAVCRAIQHAHQKGIIHRDLKPNNILVAEYDGVPVPKVIDFGVAKATGLQLTQKTVFTEFGQVIGTVEYMSPEQARRNQLDIDTRSDIYSLGIVLYQLLTGETPFGKERFQKAAWDEIIRIVREEEPPLPSEKISSSQSLDQLAKNRQEEPSRLSKLVKGDLDWIVSKTLAKDRNRRYPSAGELADDVRRHLDDEPVTASPQSRSDRFLRWAWKNRKQIAAATLGLICLLLVVDYAEDRLQQLATRNARIEQGIELGEYSLAIAMESPVGQEQHWQIASLHCNRIREAISDGTTSRNVRDAAVVFLDKFASEYAQRKLAIKIEEVLMHNASQTNSLEAWQSMSDQLKTFFRDNGFDLDQESPMEIALRIREHAYSDLWADLLELWIGTLGHMATIGGPPITPESIKPLAEAMYAAQDDELRTAIRKFIYTQPPDLETLNEVVERSDLEAQTARALSWLATCYVAAGDTDENKTRMIEIFELALQKFPRDVMLNFDYAITLASVDMHEEAVRIFQRCVTLRDDVPGFWQRLARSLEAIGDDAAAQRATARAELASQPKAKPDSQLAEVDFQPIAYLEDVSSFSFVGIATQLIFAAIVGAFLAWTTKR